MKKIVLLAVCCALLVAACGSSKSGTQAAGGPGLKLAECMRAHGLTNFPDPSSGGGIQIPAGVNPSSPAFSAAQKKCSRYFPSGPFRGEASAADKQQMLRMSECMRAHGLANFPDPVANPPSPAAGLGLAFGRPGAFIAIPQSMINSPDFNQAASACGLPGAGHPGNAKASQAPAPSS